MSHKLSNSHVIVEQASASVEFILSRPQTIGFPLHDFNAFLEFKHWNFFVVSANSLSLEDVFVLGRSTKSTFYFLNPLGVLSKIWKVLTMGPLGKPIFLQNKMMTSANNANEYITGTAQRNEMFHPSMKSS